MFQENNILVNQSKVPIDICKQEHRMRVPTLGCGMLDGG